MNGWHEFLRLVRQKLDENQGENLWMWLVIGAAGGVLIVVVAAVIDRKPGYLLSLPLAVAAGAALGAVLGLWQQHITPRLKAFVRSRAGVLIILAVVAVIGVAVAVVATAPHYSVIVPKGGTQRGRVTRLWG